MKKALRISVLTLLTALVLGIGRSVTAQTATTGIWTIGSLSKGRAGMTAAAAGTKILFASGADFLNNPSGVGLTKRLDIYDVSTDTWIADTLPIPRAREQMAAAAAGNKILFASGLDYSGSGDGTKRVDIYDVTTGTWSVDSLSQARRLMVAAAAGNKIFFAGGDGYYKRVDIYDVSTGVWSVDSLSKGRNLAFAAAVGNKVLFAGGYDEHAIVSDTPTKLIDIYDITTGTWTIDSLPRAFSYAAAVAGSKVFVAGGEHGYEASSRVDVYDATTGIWTVDSLSEARNFPAIATLNNKVFFAGGATNLGFSKRVDIYDMATGTWSIDSLSQARVYSTAASAGTKILFAGGHADNNRSSARVDIYDLAAPPAHLPVVTPFNRPCGPVVAQPKQQEFLPAPRYARDRAHCGPDGPRGPAEPRGTGRHGCIHRRRTGPGYVFRGSAQRQYAGAGAAGGEALKSILKGTRLEMPPAASFFCQVSRCCVVPAVPRVWARCAFSKKERKTCWWFCVRGWAPCRERFEPAAGFL